MIYRVSAGLDCTLQGMHQLLATTLALLRLAGFDLLVASLGIPRKPSIAHATEMTIPKIPRAFGLCASTGYITPEGYAHLGTCVICSEW